MGWGEVRDILVDGVQGRYFIPFNILLFIIMYNKNSFLDFKYNKLIALLTIFIIDFISVAYIMNFFLT
jgi:uncharacterized membrane protein